MVITVSIKPNGDKVTDLKSRWGLNSLIISGKTKNGFIFADNNRFEGVDMESYDLEHNDIF